MLQKVSEQNQLHTPKYRYILTAELPAIDTSDWLKTSAISLQTTHRLTLPSSSRSWRTLSPGL